MPKEVCKQNATRNTAGYKTHIADFQHSDSHFVLYDTYFFFVVFCVHLVVFCVFDPRAQLGTLRWTLCYLPELCGAYIGVSFGRKRLFGQQKHKDGIVKKPISVHFYAESSEGKTQTQYLNTIQLH